MWIMEADDILVEKTTKKRVSSLDERRREEASSWGDNKCSRVAVISTPTPSPPSLHLKRQKQEKTERGRDRKREQSCGEQEVGERGRCKERVNGFFVFGELVYFQAFKSVRSHILFPRLCLSFTQYNWKRNKECSPRVHQKQSTPLKICLDFLEPGYTNAIITLITL